MATEFDTLAFNHTPTNCFYRPSGNCRVQSQKSIHKYNNPTMFPIKKVNTNYRRQCSPLRASSPTFGSAKPRRPCLVNRGSEDSSSGASSSDENEPSSPSKQKKKVVFADDKGFSLTQVKVMVEPDERAINFVFPVQMKFSKPVTDIRTNSIRSNDSNGSTFVTVKENWKATFTQPASDYLNFRRKLNEQYVSLENVIIKQACNDDEISGTIKVKNICYEKSVFIRMTDDNWVSYNDVKCSFINNSSNGGCTVLVIYDTFHFRLSLLSCADKNIQFCICFESDRGRHWDNNEGNNYKIVKQQEYAVKNAAHKQPHHGLYGVKFNTWSDFAD